MSEKLLTLGVPAYNVEKYISQCLDTVLRDELEVLVVNDGSTDSTEVIAKDYEKRFPEIVRVITKKNGGWGSGVNLAIREAKGLYFKNLDSDDCFDETGLSILLENLKTSGADIVVSPSISRNEKTGVCYMTHLPNGVIYGRTIPVGEMFHAVDSVFWMHSLTFRTSLLQQNNVQIDECFYTDMELACYPFEYAETVYAQKEAVYVYRTGRDGQSMSLPSMARHMDDRKRVTDSMVQRFLSGQGGGDDDKRWYFRRLACDSIYSFITQPFAMTDISTQKEWVEILRDYKRQIIDTNSELSDYRQYYFFGNLVLKTDFRCYSPVASVWRFGKTKIAPAINSVVKRIR